MKPLKVAVVGANGRFGHKRLKALLASADPVVAVCDGDFSRVDAVFRSIPPGQNRDIARITDYRDILKESPDVVFVSTPDFLKFDIVSFFLDHGINVVAEKPLSLKSREVKSYFELASKNQVVLYTGYNLIHFPGVAAALAYSKAPDFGKVLRARMIYGHGASKTLLEQKDWRVGSDSWGGSLVDMGCHLLHLVGDFINHDFRDVYVKKSSQICRPPVEDNCYVVFQSKNGCCIEISTSWTSVRSRFALEIWGETGFVSVESLTKYERYGLAPETLNRTLRYPSGEILHKPQERWTTKEALPGDHLVSPESVEVEFLDREWACFSGLLRSGGFDLERQKTSDLFIARFFEQAYSKEAIL